MGIIEAIFLALALGIDCFVVSFSQGLIFTQQRFKNSLLLALTMGLFQGLMPCIGYFGASYIYNYVEKYSHWLVFGIFMLLGLKFIFDAIKHDKEQNECCCLSFHCLMAMGFATSIDALVAGASIKFSQTPIMLPAILIGLASFIMSLGGFWLGNCAKKFPSKYLEIFGGLILIGLAIKALVF